MRKITVIAFLFSSLLTTAQQRSSFEIKLSYPATLVTPYSLQLDEYSWVHDSDIVLSLLTAKGKKNIPCQVRNGFTRTLHWLVDPMDVPPGGKLSYLIENGKQPPTSLVTNSMQQGALHISAGNQKLIAYQFGTVYPPAGVDTNYKRSGFIHPIWTLSGKELTRIQPPDHYHHYGLWNPWTHTVFENDTVDFWNIKGRQGTVRFAKLISKINGPVFSEFETLHEHIRFTKNGAEKIVLNELQTVRVYNPGAEQHYYIIDFTSQLSCAGDSPLLIVAYRYGGFGWRATEYWTKSNMEVLTSEGKTRLNTDNTKARWIISQGELPGNDYGGMLMMSYPGNYNHPEPLRIWDQNANGGRGDYFANFATTKDKDWLLEPGKTYTLKYRLIVYNGKMNAARANEAWTGFSTFQKR